MIKKRLKMNSRFVTLKFNSKLNNWKETRAKGITNKIQENSLN
jgi:hypothetical protein